MQRSWQGRLVHASPGAAPDDRGRPGSSAPSAYSDGVSRRQKVLSRILVPVMEGCAPWAGPPAHGERQVLKDVLASRAASAARKEAVHEPELPAVPGAFVGQHPPELEEADVTNAPGHAPAPHHAAHVQVLDAEDAEAPDKVRRQLGKVVPAAVGDPGVQAGDPEPLAPPAAASLRAARQGALQPGQLAQTVAQVPGIGQVLPVGERGQAIDAEIYPHARPGLGKRLHGFIQAEAREVAPGTVLGYRNRAGRARELPGPADAQVPDLGESEASLASVPLEGGTGELRALLPMLRLEAGIGRPLLEEVAVGRLQVPEALLEGNAEGFLEPLAPGFPLPSRKGGARLGVGYLGPI